MTGAGTLSVIVPTRNRAAVLRLSLPRLFTQTLAPDAYEVIVVDDASSDDTEAVLREFARENLVVTRLAVHAAAAAARNRALELARGDTLVFLDDDCLVAPDFLQQHAAAQARRPGSVVTGPIVDVLEPPAEASPPRHRFAGWHRNPFPTGNVSVARADIVAAGGFDEDFTAYGWEDPEMFERLALRGLKRRYCGAAPVFHYKPPAMRRAFFDRIRLERERGAMGALFYAKHRRLSVGWRTKQLGAIRLLDRLVDRVADLDGRLAAASETGREPNSAWLRLLLVNHAEIEAGWRMWERLGPEKRAALRAAALRRTAN
ncbi:glycosyltransferase [Nitratireductor arenosus]|uniref:glycosyltransferase n=1 Tax=Nitratireductor arenosus TaxID=2682096 RepID=UPI0018D2553B